VGDANLEPIRLALRVGGGWEGVGVREIDHNWCSLTFAGAILNSGFGYLTWLEE
jgi:hypothetical protein